MRVIVGREAGDPLARGSVNGMEAGGARRREPDVIRLLRHVFEDHASIGRLQLHAVFNGHKSIGGCCCNSIGHYGISG